MKTITNQIELKFQSQTVLLEDIPEISLLPTGGMIKVQPDQKDSEWKNVTPGDWIIEKAWTSVRTDHSMIRFYHHRILRLLKAYG